MKKLTDDRVEISIGRSTGQRPSARNSLTRRPRVPGSPAGRQSWIARLAARPIPTTAQKVERHPAT